MLFGPGECEPGGTLAQGLTKTLRGFFGCAVGVSELLVGHTTNMARPGNPEDRRDRLAWALARVMSTRGYDGATVGEIAKEAGLAAGLVHYYYTDKRAILIHLLELIEKAVESRIEHFSQDAQAPQERVFAWIDALLARGEGAHLEAVRAWVFVGAEALRDKETHASFSQTLNKLADQLLTRMQAVVPDDTRKAQELTAAVMATVHGYFLLAQTAPELIPKGSASSMVRQFLQSSWSLPKSDNLIVERPTKRASRAKTRS